MFEINKPPRGLIEDYQYVNQSNTPTIKWHHKVFLPNENPLNLWGILNLMFFLLECKNWSHISSNWWTWIKYTWLPSNSCSIWHLTCFQTFDLFKFVSNVWIVCTSCNTVKINSISQGYNINNYSSSPNGLWLNSPWGRRLNGLLTQGPWPLVKSNYLVKISRQNNLS